MEPAETIRVIDAETGEAVIYGRYLVEPGFDIVDLDEIALVESVDDLGLL